MLRYKQYQPATNKGRISPALIEGQGAREWGHSTQRRVAKETRIQEKQMLHWQANLCLKVDQWQVQRNGCTYLSIPECIPEWLLLRLNLFVFVLATESSPTPQFQTLWDLPVTQNDRALLFLSMRWEIIIEWSSRELRNSAMIAIEFSPSLSKQKVIVQMPLSEKPAWRQDIDKAMLLRTFWAPGFFVQSKPSPVSRTLKSWKYSWINYFILQYLTTLYK